MCDFVMIRMDGSAARLHPSQNSDAHPVIGSLDMWRIHSPLPPAIPGVIHADDAAAGSTRRHLVYEAYSQADLVSRKSAQDFLLLKSEQWQPGTTFRTDLTDQDLFAWSLYLGNTTLGKELLRNRVENFQLVWLGRSTH